MAINATASGLQGAAPDLPGGLYAPDALAYDMMYGARPTAFLALRTELLAAG
ncbi:shikimate 5-dehydrogenase [Bordetella pertussis]|nr:shikimate 5-dehydrogenase [Bordetella pertussis]